ncbi:CBO0543 family protein [Virgibacillus halophilus]|uniref:CBO0543 family protein n=1 Tax=Tigheibacillus halophilus TaxID=361280 RepID=UPI0036F28B70
MHIAITIWAVVASWKFWNWERFYRYHTTMLYIATMNLLYLFFTAGYHLWKMESDIGLPVPIINMLYTFIVFPCTTILFLSRYPEYLKGQIYHNLKWIFIYIGAEWVGSLFNLITYEHGWNLGWSLLFVIMMFLMFRLHYKRPLFAYLLTFVFTVLIIYYFKIPWNIPVEDRL